MSEAKFKIPIWVVSSDYGYDGLSEPRDAFLTNEAAEAEVARLMVENKDRRHDYRITEVELKAL